MKKFFTLFVAVLAWAAMSCSDKESSEPRLDPPFQAVFVSDTGDNGALLYGRYDGASVGQVKAAGFACRPAGGSESYVATPGDEWDQTHVVLQLDGLKSGTEYEFYCYVEAGGMRYNSPVVTFRTTGTPSDDPDPDDPQAEEPRFGTPSFTEVGSSSAQLSCTYTYAGTESVSEAGFYYHTSGSTAEQKVAAAGVASPVACRLEGLTASTEYLAAAYVVVAGREYRSREASFTTSAQSTGGGSAAKFSGWPELLAEDDSNSDYYYAYHLCPDLKTSRGDKARNYTVCFSAEHHCPVWVAAPRHESYEGSANRTNAYKADPDIPADIQYYSKSTGGGCNKGHMLGSAERTCTSSVNRQVFYYSNIAPQYSSGFNTGGGGWNILEDWIDTKVCADTTYLVIGTYFEKYTDRYGNSASPKKISFGDRDDVSCPTMFYIAVLRTKSGNTKKSVVECSADELMCAVFVRCHNNNLKGKAVSAKDMISVRELEQLTGFDYFPNVPNAPKDTYNPSDWGL